jgi:beta-glucosidase
VLLKNDKGVLPLAARQGKSIAVIGSDGGNYALTSGGGSAGVIAPYVVTPAAGIAARAAKGGASVTYAQGDVPAQGALTSVPASAFGSGLNAAYYNNTTMSGTPAATGTVPDAALNWGGTSPAPGVNASGWSVKLTGTITLPAAGQYVMSLSYTGTAAVTINGQQVFASQTGFGSLLVGYRW